MTFKVKDGLQIGSTLVLDSTGKLTTALATARTISLTGDVTGSTTFDGSGNVSIAATIAADSVALGTDTTGNYMVNVSAGTGISVSHTQGEGSTATITNSGVTSVVAGNAITVSGATGAVTVNHADTSSVGNVTAATNSFVTGVTFDTYGHVTGISTGSPSGFLTTTGKAADSELLDGIDSSSFLRSDVADTMSGTLDISTGTTLPLRITTSSSGPWAITLVRSDLGYSTSAFTNGSGWYFQHTPTVGGNTIWHAANDGSGSGLDADLLDGQHGSYYAPVSSLGNYVAKTGDTMTGILTISSTNDAQLQLTSADSWTGIGFNDSAPTATDYIWHNGTNSTFAIGGAGSNVAGKKLHVHGGMTIGSNMAGTAMHSTNGLEVEGNIKAPNLQLSAANPTIYFNGTSDGGDGASSDMAIQATPEGLDFYEPEDASKIHFRIYDDTGVDAPFGYWVAGTRIVDASRNATFNNLTVNGTFSAPGLVKYFQQATVPSGSDGDEWYNTSTGIMFKRIEGAWVQQSPAAGIAIFDVNGTKVN